MLHSAKEFTLSNSLTSRNLALLINTWLTLMQIVEGNWVVKRAAGSTPAILGTKLKQHHFRGDNYLETDLEIGASRLGGRCIVRGTCYCIVLERQIVPKVG